MQKANRKLSYVSEKTEHRRENADKHPFSVEFNQSSKLLERWDMSVKIDGYMRSAIDPDEDSMKNTSIENQRAGIENYVAEHFPDAILKLYEDRGCSGYTFMQRDAYQKMRTELLSGEVQILIVRDLSRFSRNIMLGLSEMETLYNAGVHIVSVDDNVDFSYREDRISDQFKSLLDVFSVTDTCKKSIRSLSDVGGRPNRSAVL